jgi:quercetin dioxygenase-like cupin family protein
VVVVIKRYVLGDAESVVLPGRQFHTYFGPWSSDAEHLSIGLSVYPAGSRPEGHIHRAEEETIFCVKGRGRIISPDSTAEMTAGVLVHVAPGTFHATESDGPDDLELLCVFTPPVRAGSYEEEG